MDEISQPVVITAIADADFEAMVSSALFGIGWNIVARPLDFKSLEKEISTHTNSNLLVIYSVDLLGITEEGLQRLSQSKISFFGFADSSGKARGFNMISPRPTSAEELLAYIRGNIRSSILRAPLIRVSSPFKAKVIAVGAAGHSTGATTLAINLAQELALIGKKTLLVDANFSAPAIATLLDLRKLANEDKWRDYSDNLSIAEFTQHTAMNFPIRASDAATYFDFIVLDIGSITNISNELSDRRWTSQVKIWCSTFAHELLISAGSDVLQTRRLSELRIDLDKVKLPAKIKIYIQGPENKSKEDGLDYLPFDSRSCTMARKERVTLVEVNEKAPLRKAIAALARQFSV
jgi:Flp pilus assembly CpaE family ATPase